MIASNKLMTMSFDSFHINLAPNSVVFHNPSGILKLSNVKRVLHKYTDGVGHVFTFESRPSAFGGAVTKYRVVGHVQ